LPQAAQRSHGSSRASTPSHIERYEFTVLLFVSSILLYINE
jgi:hypothetical protein